MWITNQTNEAVEVNPFCFQLDVFNPNATYSGAFVSDPEALRSCTLRPGDSATGRLAFQIPANQGYARSDLWFWCPVANCQIVCQPG